MGEAKYNDRKFGELMVYLAERCHTDRSFGDTKFQKLLFWIDFGAFRRLGKPVTGAPYQRFEHGPVAQPFWDERDRLEAAGAVTTEARKFFDRKQKRTKAERPADLSVFSSDELALIEEVIVEYQHHNASDVRAKSHTEAGWLLAEEKEVIPYETALLQRGPVPESIKKRGRELVERFGR